MVSELGKSAPLDTSKATVMDGMFRNCGALTEIPTLETYSLKTVHNMFNGCQSLKDSSVKIVCNTGIKPPAPRIDMIANSGLTREPFYDRNGRPI